MAEQLSLQWRDYQYETTRTFSRFRNSEDYYDVTLVSDDDKEFTAHCLILSSCSPYFDRILKRKRNANLVLCLESVSSKDLKHILDYIYEGKVSIDEREIGKFLEIANRFQLEGLTNVTSEESKSSMLENYELKDNEHPNKNKVDSERFQRQGSFPIDETLTLREDIKVEHLDNNIDNELKQPTIDSMIESDSRRSLNFVLESQDTTIDELDEQIETMISKSDNGRFVCKVCGKEIRGMCHTREHVETHIDGLVYSCNHCPVKLKSRSTARRHVTKHQI